MKFTVTWQTWRGRKPRRRGKPTRSCLQTPAMKKVLGILASLPEAVVKGQTLEELLAQAGGLTMAEVLARPDGPAILAAVADDFFADREEADHTQAPEAPPAATGSPQTRGKPQERG